MAQLQRIIPPTPSPHVASAPKAPFDVSSYPLLDDKQAGHIRNIQNLANQAAGDWSFMGGPDSWHSGGTLFKQLGALYWPLALAHFHRLPAAPAVFKDASVKLIEKMRRVDVWGYWRDMSASGPWYDKTLNGPRPGWIDPVAKENIMFSGRLAVMAGLHSVLFNDDRYEVPGGLSLTYPYPYAGGPLTFDYSLSSLNEAIFWQIVENGYLGVSCEPNMIFIVCNQYAIIAQRLNDHRRGTNVAGQLCRSYQAAWEQKGWLNESGSLIIFYKPSEDLRFTRNYTTAWDAYALTFMNAWNPDMVRDIYPRNFARVFRRRQNGTTSIWPELLADAVKSTILNGNDPEKAVAYRHHKFGDSYYDLAFYFPFLSEVGDNETLKGLLAHADRYMMPSWRNGGLYYPRNDQSWDDAGNLTYMDPWCGNGSIAHARLNVENGLQAIYQKPWTSDHFSKPKLVSVNDQIEVLRAIYLDSHSSLLLTVRGRDGETRAELEIANVRTPGHHWSLFIDDEKVGNRADNQIEASGSVGVDWMYDHVKLSVPVHRPTNIILSWNK